VTAASISQAANDPELRSRVLAVAHQEVLADPMKAESTYGRQLAQIGVEPLMYPVAVDTEAAYQSALQAGRGAPGHDVDIITDASLTAAVNAHWPWAEGEGPEAGGGG
jgi:hypothetical protein